MPVWRILFAWSVKWDQKTGPRAKVYNGAEHQARGGAGQWSRNDGDTQRPTSSGWRWRRLKGSKTISQLSSEHEIHPNLIRAWKRQLLENGPRVFATNGERKQKEQEAQEAELYEQIGRFKMELEWLKKKVTHFGQ